MWAMSWLTDWPEWPRGGTEADPGAESGLGPFGHRDRPALTAEVN